MTSLSLIGDSPPMSLPAIFSLMCRSVERASFLGFARSPPPIQHSRPPAEQAGIQVFIRDIYIDYLMAKQTRGGMGA